MLNSFLDLFRRRKAPGSLSWMFLGPEGTNPLMLQFFEWNSMGPQPDVSWWKFFHQQLHSLSEHGVTMVWLPPPNKGMSKEGRGYDAYDLWDLGEFDQKGTVLTRWGTKEELVEATIAARDLDIGVLVDAVLNHKMGADRSETVKVVPVSPHDRRRTIGPPRDIQAWTAFDFQGRNSQYSALRWNTEHFNGVDYDGHKQGVFRFHNKKWSLFVDNERGNYDYLLGINVDHTHVEVRKDLLSWGPWVLNTMLARGFRLDAIKHFDFRFTRDFLNRCRESVARDLFAVGEYWTPNARVLEGKLHKFEGTMALFDVPLHQNFHIASQQGRAFDLRTILHDTLVERCPLDAVTFVDNHDTQPGQMLESWVDRKFKLIAYALILLRPSGCVFYGDLYPDGRNYDAAVAKALRQLMIARKRFAYGPIHDYFMSRNCIGFLRIGNDQHDGCAVVLCNDSRQVNCVPRACIMNVGKHRAGEQFRLYLGESAWDSPPVVVSSTGKAEFRSAGQVAVWVPDNKSTGES